MKLNIDYQDNEIYFITQGKFDKDFFEFKQEVFKTLKQTPEIKNLIFSFDFFPFCLNTLGFLLSLSKDYTIQILVSNYSSFRMLESLYLVEKFSVQYQKER